MVNCLIFQAIPEKKIQIIRPVTKVRVLSSIEQQELFQDKVEKKAEDESKKWMQERERKGAEKAKTLTEKGKP